MTTCQFFSNSVCSKMVHVHQCLFLFLSVFVSASVSMSMSEYVSMSTWLYPPFPLTPEIGSLVILAQYRSPMQIFWCYNMQ